MSPARFVATSTELVQALEPMRTSDFIALDTEFMRESTYFPKLCLIQAATIGTCVLIDPLATADLSPFWEFIAERSRVKVLHAARQDLEVFSLAMSGAPAPGPIFDTQIAGALLGSPAQSGYSALVAERLGTSLAKGSTRTDWTRRPLSAEQLQYAADDVRYLAPLYIELRDALVRADRLEWLYEETAELERPGLCRVEPEGAWRRLKGLDRLQPAQRAATKALAEWREQEAVRVDKPRGWILSDESLRDIAERLPATAQDLAELRSLPPGLVRRRGEDLLALVRRGRETAASEPDAFTPPRPEAALLAHVTRLMGVVRSRAEELGVSAELLATRRDIEQLVFSQRADRLLSGWRRAAIGERLIEIARPA